MYHYLSRHNACVVYNKEIIFCYEITHVELIIRYYYLS